MYKINEDDDDQDDYTPVTSEQLDVEENDLEDATDSYFSSGEENDDTTQDDS